MYMFTFIFFVYYLYLHTNTAGVLDIIQLKLVLEMGDSSLHCMLILFVFVFEGLL